MLQLAAQTDVGWARRVLADLPDVLVDHAHLEKKAAAGAVNLLFRYPDVRCLQEPLARLAREELSHFEEVLRLLAIRGVPFGRQRPSPYFGRLHARVRQQEPGRLIDLLLCSALIEARSCERLALLADVVEDPALLRLYGGLLEAEARHHGVYLELAREVAGREVADARLHELSLHEARVLAEAPAQARLHDAGRGQSYVPPP
ncbi:MAG: tRNA-(ms[2]io[6]A)-hydroxylase [Myxococcota bacterium]